MSQKECSNFFSTDTSPTWSPQCRTWTHGNETIRTTPRQEGILVVICLGEPVSRPCPLRVMNDMAKMLESLLVKASCAEGVRARGETYWKIFQNTFEYQIFTLFIHTERGRNNKQRPLGSNLFVAGKTQQEVVGAGSKLRPLSLPCFPLSHLQA